MERANLAFVLAACRRDAMAAGAREHAASRVTDWSDVSRLALAHDVAWHVSHVLPPSGVPDEVRVALADAVRRTTLDALAGVRQLTALCTVLAEAHVSAVVYKGPALAIDVHGDAGARRFTDLDVLIAEHDRDRAIAAIRSAGYEFSVGFTPHEARVYSRWEGATQLVRSGALPVELHWRCQAPRYGAPQDPAAIVARGRVLTLGGSEVRVPATDDLCVLLALHGAKHVWSSLMWLADFAAVAVHPELDWSAVVRRADEWRARRALHYALLLASELVAIEVPDDVRSAAEADAGAVALARAVAARFAGTRSEADDWRESSPRYDFRWLDGGWRWARYLWLTSILPTPRERAAVRLPDVLLPLAYPMRALRLIGRIATGRQ